MYCSEKANNLQKIPCTAALSCHTEGQKVKLSVFGLPYFFCALLSKQGSKMEIQVTCALCHAADHKCEVRKEFTELVTCTLVLAEIIDFVKQVSNVDIGITSSVIPVNKTGVREIVSIATEVA